MKLFAAGNRPDDDDDDDGWFMNKKSQTVVSGRDSHTLTKKNEQI